MFNLHRAIIHGAGQQLSTIVKKCRPKFRVKYYTDQGKTIPERGRKINVQRGSLLKQAFFKSAPKQ
jgi:hypothetical protein